MNVVLIESCAEYQDLFKLALERLDIGAVYFGTSSFEDALKKVSLKQIPKPDLIFLDLDLPVADGYACLRMMKASPVFTDIPVIIYSTPDQVIDITYMLKHGAAQNLNKSSSFLRFCNDLLVILRSVANATK